jgi:3-oxoacyl-[acyl-carrier protein] reductase
LAECTFLITGATKGIGLATAQYLISQGHHVLGVARNTDPHFPGELFLVDLADAQATLELFTSLNEQYPIDGVVNNVGIAIPGYLAEITLTDMQTTFDININPTIQATQIFTPNMIKQGWGRIVNIASLALLGLDNRSTYAAAKAALVALTRSWALELASKGVTLNVVAPGPTETERYRKYRPPGSLEEKKSLAKVPMQRIAKPAEIAAAIAFFLSEDSGFITGQTLFVDGGASIGRVML